MTIGFLGYLGLKQESEYGAEATPPDVFGDISGESFRMDNGLLRPATANGTRFARRTYPGAVTASGGMTLDMKPEGITPWLLKGLFGRVESELVEEGVYEHKFTPTQSPELPSFTMQVGHGEGRCANWLGCAVDSATISISPGGTLEMDARMTAQRPVAAATSEPFYASAGAWVAADVEFTFNGVGRLDFEDFRLEINNNVEAARTLNGERWASGQNARGFEASGTARFALRSDADTRMMWGGADAATPGKSLAPGSLSIAIVHRDAISGEHKYSLTINLPEIYYAAAEANISPAGEMITQTVAFVASPDPATGKMIEAALRNGETGYPDPECGV
jgi:hypothetical protein